MKEEPSSSADSVRAVDRALDILMAFSAADRELSASQLLQRVELSRPTLYRLLRTLEGKGFVQAFGEPQRFRLGPAVAHLSHAWNNHQDVTDAAQPMMRKLWEQTGETVALFLRQGDWRTCVAEMPSAQPLSFKRGVGYRERITVGASGRVLLAFSGPSAKQPPALEEELARIREAGYAVSRDELIPGAVALAAPFFKGQGEVAGSIVMFGPSVRLDTERIEWCAVHLKREAALLSRALGAHAERLGR